MDQFAKEIVPISLEDEMRKSYLDYAMSVIVGRALPDVRDGLKPVHRRVLFAMHEMNNAWNRPFVKCARVVGETMGKYHPHGDTSIYDTLVRMAQPFSMRHMLIDSQGNFGSVDGDNAAAMRYTECRLDKIAGELLADLEKETVDFLPNYDGREKEPSVLPARIPNLLINGSSGIAVGMATNIPPHNLTEVIDGVLHVLNHADCSIEDLLQIIQGPDFPTGGTIYGTSGVHDGYHTGRGRVIMRAKTHFEEFGRESRTAIVIDELLYQVNKKSLLERITELVRDKKLNEISDLRDESDKSGTRVVIELKRGEVGEIVLNKLYKHTQLQDTFGINMVALVDGQPRLLDLKQMLEYFLEHRREVVTRRATFELRKARERGHVLEGLSVALTNIDHFVSLVKNAATPSIAKTELVTRNWSPSTVCKALDNSLSSSLQEKTGDFGIQKDGLYRLSDSQVHEILQMRLQRLTNLEQDRIVNEYKEVMAYIADLTDILEKPERITKIIAEELTIAKNEYGVAKKGERRSQIETNPVDLEDEDLITPQNMVVTLSHTGYMKSQPASEYRAQKRGGRGKQAMTTKQDDWIEQLFVGSTHDYILCFSDHGRLYWLKIWEVPQGTRSSRGKPIVNMFPLQDGEKITAVLPLSGTNRTFPVDRYVFMCTSLGTVKKTPLSDFSNPRKAGIIAIDLDRSDFLIGVALTDGKHDVMLFSDSGKAVRFGEGNVRSMGRTARGVRGMNLESNHQVIALLVAEDEEQSVLTATEKGFGKRTSIKEYTRHGRGTKGMIAIQANGRNGKVVAATLTNPNEEIMLITDGGILIRTRVAEISEMGRATQGVKLISIGDGSKLSGVHRIVSFDANEEIDGEEEIHENTAANPS
jgi:DNA gyrase subunit A